MSIVPSSASDFLSLFSTAVIGGFGGYEYGYGPYGYAGYGDRHGHGGYKHGYGHGHHGYY